jgi:hypothetical protein
VRPATGAVLKLPSLHSADLGLGKDTVLNLRKADAVNEPLAVAALKLEVAGNGGVGRREGDGAEDVGDARGVLSLGGADNEAHRLVGVLVLIVNGDIVGLGHLANVDGLAGVLGEVDDNLPALSNANVEISRGNRLLEKARVRCNDLKGNAGVQRVDIRKVQVPASGDSSVEEAEAVLAGLDVQEGPWLAVLWK